MTRPEIDILPFEPEHLDMLEDRDEQRGEADWFHAARGMAAQRGPSFTAAEVNSFGVPTRILACAGLAENSPSYATAWAYMATGLAHYHWHEITRAIRAVLDACTYTRVDMIALVGFPAAHRYAKALGFRMDAVIYARTAERIDE